MDATTKFPSEIDDRIYFQEVDLNHLDAKKSFETYMDAQDYDTAVNSLKSSGVFYYGADVLNLFENRLVAIEEYLMDESEAPALTAFQTAEPMVTSSMSVGFTWIS